MRHMNIHSSIYAAKIPAIVFDSCRPSLSPGANTIASTLVVSANPPTPPPPWKASSPTRTPDHFRNDLGFRLTCSPYHLPPLA